MDVIGEWSGQSAAHLQAALRDSNEGFARRLGVAVRTVAAWHKSPDIVPRSEIQQALDTTYERAGEAVQRRFQLLARPPAPGPAEAQALRVAIAVVVRHAEVLLVCRRGDDSISWQFPAGIVKPGATPETVTVQETHAETGVHATIRQHIGSRLHPVSGALCDYYLCEYLMGDASNRDPLENADVQWVPLAVLPRFIPADRIYPPILEALEAQ